MGIVKVDGKSFTSTVPQSNKKMAEHTAALAAIHCLGIRDKLLGNWEED